MPVVAEVIEDGFGSSWEKCLRQDCSLQIVRPGKVQCDGEYDGIGCPTNQAELLTSLGRAIDMLEETNRG